MLPVRDLALSDMERELATTRRFLERLPDDKLDWKPHERSTTLGRLAMHLAELVGFQERVLTTDGGVDFAVGTPPVRRVATSRDDAVSTFDENATRLRAALARATDETLTATWTARRGEHIIASGPRVAILRQMGLDHVIHHRAQLGVYYRLLDVPVPSSYGPSADDK